MQNVGTKLDFKTCSQLAVVGFEDGINMCYEHAISCQDGTGAVVVREYGPRRAGINYPPTKPNIHQP